MKQPFLALFILLVTFGCHSQSSEKVKLISSSDLQKAMTNDIQLIDVRTPDEYKNHHIVNAQSIDYYSKTFKTGLEKLDKSRPVFIYCRSGSRRKNAAKVMISLGSTEIYDLDGGILSWQTKNKSPF